VVGFLVVGHNLSNTALATCNMLMYH